MKRVVVFDVNETLLDLSVMDSVFADTFGSAEVKGQWFAQLLHLSTVSAIVGKYADFGTLGKQALEKIAAARDMTLDTVTRDQIVGRMSSLPAHTDVVEGLDILAEAGFQMVALSNSAMSSTGAVLEQADLARYFSHILSVETVGVYKPRPEPYLDTAERLEVDIEQIRMVAAHDWDCAGALSAGASAAFLQRPGKVYADLYAPADLNAETLPELARMIVNTDEPA